MTRVFQNKGFTLLELVIAVLVMGLALAVTYPSMSRGSTALRLRAASRDILSTLRYAREKAVTEQMTMRMTVNLETQNLTLSNELGEGSRAYALPHDIRIRRVSLAGQEILGGAATIRFRPNGSSDSAEILLRSDTGSFMRIVSDPISAGARIEPGRGENAP